MTSASHLKTKQDQLYDLNMGMLDWPILRKEKRLEIGLSFGQWQNQAAQVMKPE